MQNYNAMQRVYTRPYLNRYIMETRYIEVQYGLFLHETQQLQM